jgi:hypothetical protein
VTLWHINDFKDRLPNPLPWNIIGVLPTRQDYLRDGDAVYNPHNCFCYTVSKGPTEVWCPLTSIEGRFCPPELIADVVNIIFTAVGRHELDDGDNVLVPFEYNEPFLNGTTLGDGVFWIGEPTDDPYNDRYHCYASPNTSIRPLQWSSPQGWQ